MTTEFVVNKKVLPTSSDVVIGNEVVTKSTFIIIERPSKNSTFSIQDGVVPWESEIYKVFKGNTLTMSTVIYSIHMNYGKNSVSEGRIRNWINQLDNHNIVTTQNVRGQIEITF